MNVRMLRCIALVCFAVLMLMSSARADPLPGPIPADVLRIVDGDTLKVRAHIWPGQHVEILVRLAGVDAPEIHRSKCPAERRLAERAKAAIEALSYRPVYLRNVKLGKYAGRVVAEVTLKTGENLATYLLHIGLAVPDGEAGTWCQPARSVLHTPISPP